MFDSSDMRVVSLLPCATDTVVALGQQETLVGRSHEVCYHMYLLVLVKRVCGVVEFMFSYVCCMCSVTGQTWHLFQL